MPSPFIHYFFGVILSDFFGYTGKQKLTLALVSLLPDVDFITLFLVRPIFKLTKNHPLVGRAIFHRGITHTFLFSFAALILSLVVGQLKISLFIFLSLLFHIVWDYISIWGVNPLFPFLKKNYAANLFSIHDVPMTLLLFFTSLASFYSTYLFAILLVLCVMYLLSRFLFKRYIQRKTGALLSSVVPTSSLHYAYAKEGGNRYYAGKFNVLSWKNETRAIDSDMERKKDLSPLLNAMGKTFVEFPVFTSEGRGTRIFDARSTLFTGQTPFSMMFYVEDGHVFLVTGWGKVEVPPAWASW